MLRKIKLQMSKSLIKSFFFLKKDDKGKGYAAFLNMFTPREDASVIDSSCKSRPSVSKE